MFPIVDVEGYATLSRECKRNVSLTNLQSLYGFEWLSKSMNARQMWSHKVWNNILFIVLNLWFTSKKRENSISAKNFSLMKT